MQKSPEKCNKKSRDLENMAYEERSKELSLLNLEKTERHDNRKGFSTSAEGRTRGKKA